MSKNSNKESAKEESSSQKLDIPTPETWDLEADRKAIHQPLVECLVKMAGYYGRRTSVNSLTAGLPYQKNGVTPTLFERSAVRADLDATLIERSIESLVLAPNLPCILILKDKQACILWEIKHSAKKKEPVFVVQFPETSSEKQTISLNRVSKLYDGFAYFVRPVARTDERAGPAEIDTTKNWFIGVLWQHRSLYAEVVLASMLINIFALTSSLYIMNIYDRVIPNQATDTLLVLTGGVFLVFFFDFVLKNLRAQFLDYAGRGADIKISASIFEQIMGMTLTARPASAGVLASHVKEFEILRDFFTSSTLSTLIDLPFIVIFIFIIMLIGGPIAFIPLAATVLVILIGLSFQKPMEKVIRQSINESALKNAHLFETVTGLETIKTQAAESNSQRRWEELTDKASLTSIKMRKLAAYATNSAGFVQQISTPLVVVAGFFLISEEYITIGALVACVLLTSRAIAPLALVAGLMTRLNQSKEALNHLNELMSKPVERPADRNFISIPRVKGDIDYKDITFHYPNQTRPAVKDLNLHIKAGEHIGIIGSVGSGKTTIERLLHNLYQPDTGSVQLDGTDVRQIDPGDLRRNIGVVQQSPQLFYGSIRHNITMGHEMATEAAVLRAAQMAGVLEFIRETETGLDTQVGERGEALSGGQRQAVAVARALLYDPPVLVLDEPTASMDPASEARLRKRLEHITDGRTVILITHRGSMLTLVDKLLLMDKGQIVAYGPKKQIIKKLQAREYGSSAENTTAV